MKQAEELQLVDVKVADGLHHGQLGQDLHGVGKEGEKGIRNMVICLLDPSNCNSTKM